MLNRNDQTNLDIPPISPIDGNTTVIESNDKGLTQDQLTLKALISILEILTRPNTTIATKDWAHGMLQKIMARCDNDDDTESVNSDITNDITMLHNPGVCPPLQPGSFQQTRVPNSLLMGVNYVDYEPQGTEVIPIHFQSTTYKGGCNG